MISIHVPLAGHDWLAVDITANWGQISIHVPLAGHDHLRQLRSPRPRISIHVPLAGHDGHW